MNAGGVHSFVRTFCFAHRINTLAECSESRIRALFFFLSLSDFIYVFRLCRGDQQMNLATPKPLTSGYIHGFYIVNCFRLMWKTQVHKKAHTHTHTHSLIHKLRRKIKCMHYILESLNGWRIFISTTEISVERMHRMHEFSAFHNGHKPYLPNRFYSIPFHFIWLIFIRNADERMSSLLWYQFIGANSFGVFFSFRVYFIFVWNIYIYIK